MIFICWLLVGFIGLPVAAFFLGLSTRDDYRKRDHWKAVAGWVVVMGIMYMIPSNPIPLGFDGSQWPLLHIAGTFSSVLTFVVGCVWSLCNSFFKKLA